VTEDMPKQNREEFLISLLKNVEKEKRRSRYLGILELIGFIILIAGFTVLFFQTKKLRQEESDLRVEIDDFEQRVADANAQIKSERANLAALNNKITQAISLIDTNEVDSARILLNLSKNQYTTRIRKDELSVNEFKAGRSFGESSTKIEAGRIYVWAYINSPENTTITLKWISLEGKIFRKPEKPFDIGINTDRGFRIYDYKGLSPGNYRVEIFDANGLPLDALEFEVV
jgi:uncharacterized membrane-anchored protein YhcB (DUF1043 family)